MIISAISLLVSVSVSKPSISAPIQDPSTVRWLGACQAWGSIKFFHPLMQTRKGDWDRALMAIVPKLKTAKNEDDLAEAVRSMLAYARVPDATVEKAVAEQQPKIDYDKYRPLRMQEDTLIFDIWAAGWASRDRTKVPEYVATFDNLIKQAKSLVIDCRILETSSGADYWGANAFQSAMPQFVKGSIAAGTTANVSYLGYPAPGGASPLYSSGLRTKDPDVIVGTAKSDKPIVFIVDDTTDQRMRQWAVGFHNSRRSLVIKVGKEKGITAEMASVPISKSYSIDYPTRVFLSAKGSPGFDADMLAMPNSDREKAVETALTELAAGHTASTGQGAQVQEQTNQLEESIEDEYPSESARVLSLFRIWNIVNHFFPYRHLMDQSWPKTFEESLPRFLNAKTSEEYYFAVSRMTGRMQDAHVWMPDNPRYYAKQGNVWPRIRFRWVEGKYVVSAYDEAEVGDSKVTLGDELLTVDGESTQAIISKFADAISAGKPVDKPFQIMPLVMAGQPDTEIAFAVRRKDGTIANLKLKRKSGTFTKLVRIPVVPTQPAFTVLPSGFGYIDLRQLSVPDIDKALQATANTPGLIFDLRGYPQLVAWQLSAKLATKRSPTYNYRVASPDFSDYTLNFKDDQCEEIPSSLSGIYSQNYVNPAPGPKYQGKVVVLINQDAISLAEHTCLLLAGARPVTFIGTATSGANGDLSGISVPGGIYIRFSGADISWPSGKALQKSGVVPDVVAAPTIQGMLNGRDDVLEAAIAFLSK